LDISDGPARQNREARRVECFARIDNVDQVMRDATPLAGFRFGGSDVQPLVNLHGIDRNDFTARARGELKGDG
jgi:hypothetical protein